MKFRIEKRDLFTVNEDYYLAHCISTDAKMGAGIAVLFKKKFPDIKVLEKDWEKNNKVGTCKKIGRVLNLMSKKRYWQKPTYDTLTASLVEMKQICLEEGIEKVAMPLIGCGLDKLQWGKVELIIKEIFEDTEIEILVCKI